MTREQLTRDQARALHAYRRVELARDLGERARDEYRGYALELGPSIVRSGLASALAFIERDRKRDAAKLFLADIGTADIPGLAGSGEDVAKAARELTLDSYILATRETLKVCVWFKRAVQALLGGAA